LKPKSLPINGLVPGLISMVTSPYSIFNANLVERNNNEIS